MKRFRAIFAIALFLGGALVGLCQGFANFDFESADLTGYSPGDIVPATNAFPNWIVSAPYIFYDGVSLSGGSIDIIDTNSPYYTTSSQGKFYASFASVNLPGYDISISLGQTVTIPLSAKSVTFWGDLGSLQITFNGNLLYFSSIGNGANYTIYSADVSTYAGQTGELLFTVPPLTVGATLDNIQFSTTPVPEPGELTLAALGAVLFSFCRRKSPA